MEGKSSKNPYVDNRLPGSINPVQHYGVVFQKKENNGRELLNEIFSNLTCLFPCYGKKTLTRHRLRFKSKGKLGDKAVMQVSTK